MSDLVQRLRYEADNWKVGPVVSEAADRIEALEAALMDLIEVQKYCIGFDNGVTDSTGTIREGEHWHGMAMIRACAALGE